MIYQAFCVLSMKNLYRQKVQVLSSAPRNPLLSIKMVGDFAVKVPAFMFHAANIAFL